MNGITSSKTSTKKTSTRTTSTMGSDASFLDTLPTDNSSGIYTGVGILLFIVFAIIYFGVNKKAYRKFIPSASAPSPLPTTAAREEPVLQIKNIDIDFHDDKYTLNFALLDFESAVKLIKSTVTSDLLVLHYMKNDAKIPISDNESWNKFLEANVVLYARVD